MKRHPALSQLSREHHSALVLAKRAQQATNPEVTASFMAAIGAIFARELEPHFRVEEERLLPLLRHVGQAPLVERTLVEHEELRLLVGQFALGDASGLRRFGELLAAHVRFEERELFPVAEAHLEPQALASVKRDSKHVY